MIPHTTHVLDTVVLLATTVATATTSLVLQDVAPTATAAAEVQLFLLPLLGGLLLSGGIIMLNPQPETRRITIGRSMVAVFFGVLLPQVLGIFHPALASLSLQPSLLLLSGGMFSALAYVLSRPLTEGLYKRAGQTSDRMLDELEQKFLPATPVEPETQRIELHEK